MMPRIEDLIATGVQNFVVLRIPEGMRLIF
jgi:hypothetical protein